MKLCRAIAIAIMLACSSAVMAQQRPAPFASAVLQSHNIERRMAGAPPLAWSAALAASADHYALQLARSGRWGHSPRNQRVGQGENLWMGSRGAYPPQAMIAAWSDEKKAFRAGFFPNVSRTGSWSEVGHYTQMVWPTTASVGCALRSSARWDYLVCRYARPGNVDGQPVGMARIAAR